AAGVRPDVRLRRRADRADRDAAKLDVREPGRPRSAARRRRVTMRARRPAIAWLLCAGALVAGCGRPGEIEPRPDQMTDFAALYASNCAGCHGMNGRRGVAQPLNDPAYLSLVSDATLRNVIARGVPSTPMAAFGREAGGSLTAAQVNALVEG